MDKKQIASFLKQVMGAYPSFTPMPERLEIWGRHLSELDYDLAIKRLDKHIRTAGSGKFAPSISDIINKENTKKPTDTDTMSPATIIYGHRFVDSDEWN